MTRTQAFGLVIGLALGVTLSWLTPANAARNGSGTYSLPNTGSVPNPVTSGNVITAAWANGTLSDISTELTNSLDRGGRGAMTAPLQLASGTAGAPGLTFSADTNTGLYRVGADSLALTAGGTARLTVASTLTTSATDYYVIASGTADDAMRVTGASNQVGLRVTGGNATTAGARTGAAIHAQAGTYGETAINALGSANGGDGINVTAYASGTGVAVAAGASSDGGTGGIGVSVSAGDAPGGIGGIGVNVSGGDGTTGGVGAYIVGGAGGAVNTDGIGLAVATASNSTGALRNTAIKVYNGDIDLDQVPTISSTTSVTNRLTPDNLPKAWANITIGESPTVNSGFNITGVACDTGDIVVTLGGDMAAANFVCIIQTQNTGASVFVCRSDLAAGTVRIQAAALTACNATYNSDKVGILVFGNQ